MVTISKPAREDLRQIHDYIAQDSLYYAHEVIQSLIDRIRYLEKFPHIGKMVYELQDEAIREIVVYSYRIVYRVTDTIEVAAVIHAKRNFPDAIKDRLPE